MSFLKHILFVFCLLLVGFSVTGCASYSFGYSQRSMPGGYKQTSIPVFLNKSKQVNAEKYFTNALIREFDRSQVAEVISQNESQVTIIGRIKTLDYKLAQESLISGDDPIANQQIKLPSHTVLATTYQVLVTTEIDVVRNSDQKIIWHGSFDDSRYYTAPQIGLPVINSANPLYNQSNRNSVIEDIAKDMMHTAHDRMTENF